jgi:ribokinase
VLDAHFEQANMGPTPEVFTERIELSFNHDLVCEVERIPSPGETVFATRTRSQAGGKGANQAVAAARAGADVALVGNIGDDEIGPVMLAAFRSAGVAVASVASVEGTHTGTAYITVGRGQNAIVVDRGANWQWPHGLAHAEASVRLATVVVAQMEVPDEIIRLAARASGSRFVLNAAPARPVPTEVMPDCDPLVVNEHELAVLCGGTTIRTPRQRKSTTLRLRPMPGEADRDEQRDRHCASKESSTPNCSND